MSALINAVERYRGYNDAIDGRAPRGFGPAYESGYNHGLKIKNSASRIAIARNGERTRRWPGVK